MEEKEIKKLAAKLLQGKATNEEKQILHNWYDRKNIHEDEQIELSGSSPKNRMYKTIQSHLSTKVNEGIQNTNHAYRKWVWSAAIALILITASIMYFSIPDNTAGEIITLKVPLGNMEKIILPDSSVAWVNAGSHIRYPERFPKSERKVELIDGQAFFDVVEGEDWPFVVVTHKLKVSVVGTSFEVKSYDEESSTIVGVQSGKVTIHHQNQEKVFPLQPGDQIVVDNNTGDMTKSDRDPQTIGVWKDNQLLFEDEPLRTVLLALERKYNVDIITADSEMLGLPVSIKLNTQPLTDVLDVLGFSLDFKYEMLPDSEGIKIYKN